MVRNTSDSKVRRSENCLRRRNTTRVSRRVRGKEKGECEEEEEDEVVGGEERNRIKSGQRCALKTSNNSGCWTNDIIELGSATDSTKEMIEEKRGCAYSSNDGSKPTNYTLYQFQSKCPTQRSPPQETRFSIRTSFDTPSDQ